MDKKIYGKKIANEIQQDLILKINELKKIKKFAPHLTVIQVGDNESSNIYIRNKKNACEKIGIKFSLVKLPLAITQKRLINIITKLNADETVTAILLQLPLPYQINDEVVLSMISSQKDADGITPESLGNLMLDTSTIMPATPKGILMLFQYYNIELVGKQVTIIGRSNIVGKPLANLLINKRATVSICNSKTKKIKTFTKNADIIIIAIGQPLFLKKSMVKKNSIIIDVGINYLDNKIVGDADYSNLYDKVSLISPVPGGVGPMTITGLLINIIELYKKTL